jgi:putative ABC transport system permease protein
MSMFRLSRKNVTVNWWRSMTLGSFIFLATFMLMFFNSFINTMEDNLHAALSNALTGDVQIRPGNTTEDDMFSLKGSFDKISYLTKDQVDKSEQVIKDQMKPVDYTVRIRSNAVLVSKDQKQPSIIIGMQPKATSYQQTFKLDSGSYLSTDKSNEVMLPKLYADKLGVKVGDQIDIQTMTRDKKPSQVTVTVVGIGDADHLSNFSFYPVYMDLQTATTLTGFNDGEATDIIAYVKDRNNATADMNNLNTLLSQAGFAKGDLKVTTWQDMGGFLMSTIGIYIGLFYAFIAILLVIMTILIINLIFMMGLERRQEIGTLRAIGFSKTRIVSLFLGEILFITLVFFLIGLVLSIALVLLFSHTGISVGTPMDTVLGKTFYMHFDPTQIWPVIVIIFGFTLLAALYPSLKSASVRPAETLREV